MNTSYVRQKKARSLILNLQKSKLESMNHMIDLACLTISSFNSVT